MSRRGRGCAVTAAVVLVVLAVGVFGCSKILSSSGSSSDGLSAKTSAYADDAMRNTDKALRKFNAGDTVGAAAAYLAIPKTMPVDTAADQVLSGDLLAYINNARYYMIGDGSATLKDVEDSRQNAVDTLASLRP